MAGQLKLDKRLTLLSKLLNNPSKKELESLPEEVTWRWEGWEKIEKHHNRMLLPRNTPLDNTVYDWLRHNQTIGWNGHRFQLAFCMMLQKKGQKQVRLVWKRRDSDKFYWTEASDADFISSSSKGESSLFRPFRRDRKYQDEFSSSSRPYEGRTHDWSTSDWATSDFSTPRSLGAVSFSTDSDLAEPESYVPEEGVQDLLNEEYSNENLTEPPLFSGMDRIIEWLGILYPAKRFTRNDSLTLFIENPYIIIRESLDMNYTISGYSINETYGSIDEVLSRLPSLFAAFN